MKPNQGYQKILLCNALAFHTLSSSKEDVSSCARDFLNYIQSTGNILDGNSSRDINRKIAEIASDKQQRQIIQIVNMNLTIDEVEELFPDLLKEDLNLRQNFGEDKSDKRSVRDFVSVLLQKINPNN